MNLLYAMARASNRAQIDFCSADNRLFFRLQCALAI